MTNNNTPLLLYQIKAVFISFLILVFLACPIIISTPVFLEQGTLNLIAIPAIILAICGFFLTKDTGQLYLHSKRVVLSTILMFIFCIYTALVDNSISFYPVLTTYPILVWILLRGNISKHKWYIIGVVFLIYEILLLANNSFTISILSIYVPLLTFILIGNKKDRFYHAKRMGLTAFLLSIPIYSIISDNLIVNILLGWCIINFIWIGSAYILYRKWFLKDDKGNIPHWKRLLLLPYEGVNWLSWYIYRLKLNKSHIEVLRDFHIGRRLSNKEAKEFAQNKKVIVFDLSPELEECKFFKNSCTYYFYPLLNYTVLKSKYTHKVVEEIYNCFMAKKEDEVIYLHCAMGETRAVLIGALVLHKITGKEVPILISDFTKEQNYITIPHYVTTDIDV